MMRTGSSRVIGYSVAVLFLCGLIQLVYGFTMSPQNSSPTVSSLKRSYQGRDSRQLLSAATELTAETTSGEHSLITVSHEGQSCEITVHQGETILAALERQSRHLQSHLTALPEMPSDCRRGNCLTCAASCVASSAAAAAAAAGDSSIATATASALVRADDGLSPAMSQLVKDKGYVLTCSSYVQATDGQQLELKLGEQYAAWKEVYHSPGRFTTANAQLVARAAMAKTIRKSAERNMEQFVAETEQTMLRKSGD